MVVNRGGSGFLTTSSTYLACDLGQVTQLRKALVAMRLKKDSLFGTMPGAQKLSRERQTDFVRVMPCPMSLEFWMEREIIRGRGVLPCIALGIELGYIYPFRGTYLFYSSFLFGLFFLAPPHYYCGSRNSLNIFFSTFLSQKLTHSFFLIRVFIASHKGEGGGGGRRQKKHFFPFHCTLPHLDLSGKDYLCIPKAKAFILVIFFWAVRLDSISRAACIYLI